MQANRDGISPLSGTPTWLRVVPLTEMRERYGYPDVSFRQVLWMIQRQNSSRGLVSAMVIDVSPRCRPELFEALGERRIRWCRRSGGDGLQVRCVHAC